MDQSTMQSARNLIIKHEGFKAWPYKDSRGFLTIGYGHCLATTPITSQAAKAVLDDDMTAVVYALQKYAPVFDNLCPERQAVLIDMTYNLGITGILKFADMWASIEKEDWKAASDAMLNSKWALEVGKRAMEDANIMLTGKINLLADYGNS